MAKEKSAQKEKEPEGSKRKKEVKKVAKQAKESRKPEPKVEKKAAVRGNPWDILLYPHLAEKSMNMVEIENKLIFIVRRDAAKPEIKKAVESGFDDRICSISNPIYSDQASLLGEGIRS